MLFRGIFLVCFATLLFEVSLIRLLSFTIWHHFGYVVISTALLGFGANLALLTSLGAQNTFLIRQGLARNHVGLVAVICIQVPGTEITEPVK